uniref:V-myb avian myeloblastosis viral oncogene homolog-like 1 n=1 Tax=Hippocampus comes TaxID=109280 RepID=A0A3Q3DET7_HIPCM
VPLRDGDVWQVVELVRKFGKKHWSLIAKHMRSRNGKQCRERWLNHLNPKVIKSRWTPEEDRIICQAQRVARCGVARPGPAPARAAARPTTACRVRLPRPDNAIKNRWNSTLKRKDHPMSSDILNMLSEWSPSHSAEHKDRAALMSRSEVNHRIVYGD